MLNSPAMTGHLREKARGAVFITFSGNCRRALRFYQSCFGGKLHFDAFDKKLQGFSEVPVVSGSLVSESITIYGSDLVHTEGRKLGNYIAIFLPCKSTHDRNALIGMLSVGKDDPPLNTSADQQLVEITDAFDVRWILGV